jgi:hypothetical protein
MLLRKKQLYARYISPNIIRMIKLRRMRWAEHVARMGDEEKYIRSFGGKI